MDRIEELLSGWKADRGVAADITSHTVLAPRGAEHLPWPPWVPQELRRAWAARGVTEPYSHQAEAMEHIRQDRDMVLVTPTASGKTLAYNVPVLAAIREQPETRALYVFPTKALAQDQYHELLALSREAGVPVRTHTFDGDTPGDAREAVRETGHVVMTNPDMLHSGILPHHPRWLKLFANLRYVVLDEVHTYRGVFGSHMANVLRRLLRVALFHGGRPVFVCCSATIANPGELAARLIGRPVEVVERSGAPRGRRHVVLYNPPVVNSELGIRASYLQKTRSLVQDLLRRDLSVIVFALSRLNVELLLKYLREGVGKEGRDPAAVQGYRGGYLPSRRREIEAGIREGRIRCVVATNALELGIDIGSLEACVVAGYPGTQASLWQQWGRSGRRAGTSLALLVARSTPVDQYLAGHPDFLLGRSPESALLDPDNPCILADHVKCAAFELPFDAGEAFGTLPPPQTGRLLDLLAEARLLHRAGDRYHWMQETFPASTVSLRNIPGQNFVVVDVEHGRVVAEVDFVGAHTTLHPEAIHNVEGVQYQVKRLDYDGRRAEVERVETDYFTDAESYVQVKVLDVEVGEDHGPASRQRGEVAVTEKVVGFKKIRFYTAENVGYGQVNLPELTLHTTGVWLTLGADLLPDLMRTPEEIQDALLGLGRAMHAVAALHLMCSVADLGRCIGDRHAPQLTPAEPGMRGRYHRAEAGDPRLFSPTLFFYDRRPGGVGLSEHLYEIIPGVLEHSRRLVRDCPCTRGCPACIGPPAGGGRELRGLAMEIAARLVAAFLPGHG
ncbi:MAG: DEAD/DEAH box helicase [Deltaproteobacteria bacterium]|nr:DEAD/DEAH box helicase [Deltaproteobacteria bacterium]